MIKSLNLLKEEFERRVADGRVVYYPSAKEVITERGYTFELAYCPTLVRRFKEERSSPTKKTPINPFLPCDERTFIREIPPHHNLLYNKYCIAPMHLLITTREYEPQESLLNVSDFEAVQYTINLYPQYEWLVFYNCGKLSGASQPHKHIQLFPITTELLKVTRLFPRNHLPIGATDDGIASSWYDAYMQLVKPYKAGTSMNVLLTKQWLLLIPRKQDVIGDGWKPNSVLFAGIANIYLLL